MNKDFAIVTAGFLLILASAEIRFLRYMKREDLELKALYKAHPLVVLACPRCGYIREFAFGKIKEQA